ncbi:MAG: hypothetical protein ACRD3W_19555, partial [Terriglobales bacterium]
FWKERSVDGLGWAVGGAIGGAIGGYASNWLGGAAANEVSESSIKNIADRGLTAIMKGSSSNIARTAVTAALGTESVTAQTLSERLIQGITKSAIVDAVD